MINYIQRSLQTIFMLSSMMLISGCATKGILTIGTDKTLPRITEIKHLVGKSSVGFEWPLINDDRVQGIKIYRNISSNTNTQKYVKIATINDRYTTHFVDRKISHNQTYFYTFVTYSLLKESLPGTIIRVQTLDGYDPVSFVKTYNADKGVVKVLWTPHSNPEISAYIIERKIAEQQWKYLATVKGRLMPEYIDKSAISEHKYSYRIIATNSAGVKSIPSQASEITVK